jgi:hypothetical protein
MEEMMETTVLERVTTSAPVKSRLQFGRKHLAIAGLALAVTLGGVGYGRYWWSVGRFIESTDGAYVANGAYLLSVIPAHALEEVGLELFAPLTRVSPGFPREKWQAERLALGTDRLRE